MADITALLIPPNEPPTTVRVPAGELAAWRQLVDGNIEGISCRSDDPGWAATINEDGKRLALPSNPVATQLAIDSGFRFLPGDHLVGPVVFHGLPMEGDETSVPQQLIDRATTLWESIG